MTHFRRVVLRQRPVGLPKLQDFDIDSTTLPDPAPGEVIIRNSYISLDPGLRQRLSQVDSYVKIIDIGTPLTSSILGQVIKTAHPDYMVGDHVVAFGQVAECSIIVPGPLTRKIDLASTASPSNHLSVLGPTGLTAYFGLLDIGQPQRGETVLVSAAAGAVGSIVGQIARIQGCRAVGIAGGATKCRRLIEEFGFDAAIDYRGKELHALTEAIGQACPAGVDVFFDNVGGIQLDAALDRLNPRARVALCGLIGQYNGEAPAPMTNLFRLIAKSARIEGFVMLSYASRFPAALSDLSGWVTDGRLRFREQIEEGLERAVPGFLRLFEGTNEGKMILQI